LLEISSILCPVDLSDVSRRALDYAATLAHWYESRITILHVAGDTQGVGGPPTDGPAAGRSPAIVADEVHAFCRPWTSRGEPVEVVISAGQVVKEIVQLTESLPADLLVVGTHGRSGFERLWLGSVSDKVLRKVVCPALTVPPKAGPAPAEIRFNTILCPIDFSDASLRALEYAFSLAEESLSRLILMHVVEPLAEMGFKDESAALAVPEYQRHLIDDATALLKTLVPEDTRVWCRPETNVATGKPHREILRAATELGAELIVMGVLGRGAIDLALFGSTTHHVIRAAACPVLTVRAPDPG
jgi:nucleotide-binding universal stress UspA family protein